MAAGVAVDIVVGSIPCEVSKPPLTPEVTSRKDLCSLDDFLEVEMFINEGSYPNFGWLCGTGRFCCLSTSRNIIVLGQPETSSVFTSCIVVQPTSDRCHNVRSYFGALPNILYLELYAALRSECNP